MAAITSPSVQAAASLRTIRIWLTVFIVGLILSGLTAFSLQLETTLLVRAAQHFHGPQYAPALYVWLTRVSNALANTGTSYPFLAYGTDWLAFGHLVIAIAFIGPWLDPVRNKWFITFGLVACAGVIPLALIAGPSWANSRHSVVLASHRLQFRGSRIDAAPHLQSAHPAAGTTLDPKP